MKITLYDKEGHHVVTLDIADAETQRAKEIVMRAITDPEVGEVKVSKR